MSWSREVFSSNVQTVAYDSDTFELVVTFQNGSSYAYSGVDEGTAIALSKAPSVGGMLNAEIKGRYPHRKLS